MLSSRHLVPVLIAIALAACSSSLAGWDPIADQPPRPELPDGVDPGDAYEVYRYGESLLERSPGQAAQAFYWASRLAPLWADPIYARRIALFMERPEIFVDYVFDRRKVARLPGIARLDSLYEHALRLNPFLQRKHDLRAIEYALTRSIEASIRRESPSAIIDQSAIRHYLDVELNRAGGAVRGLIAESEGRLNSALELYGKAADSDADNVSARIDLARVQFRLGQYDAARASFGRAIELLRERDEEDLIRVYESKVLLEHSIGLILEQTEDPAAAREAYARALQEDISYVPAHVRLAELALADGDTTTALSEFALAAEIDPQNGGLGFLYGQLLTRTGDLAAAERELRRAIDLEPHFAAPFHALAEVLERTDRPTDAAAMYREFLERASRSDADRPDTERRLRELAAGGATSAGAR